MGEPEECRGCIKNKEKSCIQFDIEDAIYQGKDIPICPNLSDLVTNQPNKRPPEETIKRTSPDERSPSADSGEKSTDNGKILSHSKQPANKNEHPKKQKSSFSGTPLGPSPLKLTKTEVEYVRLLSQGITDTKRIANMRKCSVRIAQKHIKNLRQKGIINNLTEIVRNIEGYGEHSEKSQTVLPRESNPIQHPAGGGAVPKKRIRLHGQQLWLKILYKDERYQEKINNPIQVLGNTVLCHRDVIEIYSNTSFTGYDINEIVAQSLQYWRKVTTIIENDLKITLMKERAQNIKLAKAGEYSEVGNELAKKCLDDGEKIRIIDEKDGLWFLIDSSFREAEAETVHPQTAKQDMQGVVQPFFNDLRINKPPKLSEIMYVIDKTVQINQETASGLNAVITFLKSQLPKELGEKQETSQAPKEKSKPEPVRGYG